MNKKSSLSDTDILKPSLKDVNSEIKNYIHQLEAENCKLQKKIAELQVKLLSTKNRAIALEEEIKKLHFPEDLSDDELNSHLKEWFERLATEYGYVKAK